MALLSRKKPDSTCPIGLTIQTNRLDLACIERQTGGLPKVTRCESYPLTGGLAASLAKLRQGGKLDGQCTTLLAAGEYQFLTTEAPPVPESSPATELREAVRWKIKDMVDFPVTAAGIDALRIPVQPGRPPQLLAIAASHGVLKPRIESFQNAKANLVAIDLPELAQRNIAQLFETQDRALALLTFSAQGGLLTLSCNGELYSTRRIDISATDLARDKGLYERAVLDVQRSLDNFERNFSQLSLQRLLVLPVPAADDFIQHLRDNLYQPVEALRIEEALDISDAPMLANAATLADALPALGAALRNDTLAQINLFDANLQQQYDPWTARNLGLSLSAVGTLALLAAGWAYWQNDQAATALRALEPQLQAARAQSKQLSTRIAEHQPDTKLQAELVDNRNRLEARGEVLALLKRGLSPESSNQADWLRGFARQIPNGLWLTAFSINSETGALEIHGRTTNPALIPEYIRRLNAEKAFQGRTFAALDISNDQAAPAPASGNTAQANPALTAPPAATSSPNAPATSTSKITTPAPRYHDFALTSSHADAAPGGRS